MRKKGGEKERNQQWTAAYFLKKTWKPQATVTVKIRMNKSAENHAPKFFFSLSTSLFFDRFIQIFFIWMRTFNEFTSPVLLLKMCRQHLTTGQAKNRTSTGRVRLSLTSRTKLTSETHRTPQSSFQPSGNCMCTPVKSDTAECLVKVLTLHSVVSKSMGFMGINTARQSGCTTPSQCVVLPVEIVTQGVNSKKKKSYCNVGWGLMPCQGNEWEHLLWGELTEVTFYTHTNQKAVT